jgi:hypothetical protein
MGEKSAFQQQSLYWESQCSTLSMSFQSEKQSLDASLEERLNEIGVLKTALEEKSRETQLEVKRLQEESVREIELMKSKRLNARSETIEMAQALEKSRNEAHDLATLIKFNLIPLVFEQIYSVESLLMGLDVVQSYLVTKASGGGKRPAPTSRPRARDGGRASADNDPVVGAMESAQTLQSELYRLQTGITLMNQCLQNMQDAVGSDQNNNGLCCSTGSFFEMVSPSPVKSKGSYRTLSSQGDDRAKLTLMRDEST